MHINCVQHKILTRVLNSIPLLLVYESASAEGFALKWFIIVICFTTIASLTHSFYTCLKCQLMIMQLIILFSSTLDDVVGCKVIC